MMGCFVVEGNDHVVVGHFAGHGLVEDFFDGSHGLAGAVTGSSGAVDLGGAVFVEAHGEFGTGAGLEPSDSSEGNHFALGIFDEKLANIFGTGAVGTFGFDVDLPLAAGTVGIVDEQDAPEGLKSLGD